MKRDRLIELKVYVKRRKSKKKKACCNSIQGLFSRLSRTVYTSFFNFFCRKGFIDRKYINSKVIAPSEFSFEQYGEDSITFFKIIMSSYLLTDNSITIDFTNCRSIDISNATLLDIIIKEFTKIKYSYNNKYYHKTAKRIKYIPSKYPKTNKCLFAFELINKIDGINEGEGYLYLGLKRGWAKRTSYKENKKGAICREVREFINSALKQSDAILNPAGVNKIDRLLSEIFNNAEDHSILNEWYVNGVAYKNIVDDEPIVELNLSILNLGFSIAEGILRTRQDNTEVFEVTEKWYAKHLEQMKKWNKPQFKEEDLYSLYCLQEGISRLKYKDESRGNGTMNFLRAFIELGAFGIIDPEYKSHLNIISGKNIVNCDNERAPYEDEDGTFWLSLNQENNLEKLPEPQYLKRMRQYFPGTFLEVKIYLNKTFFEYVLTEE